MSGHSKWSQIKRQKGSADAKRGVLFSKLAHAITLAARGGADPAKNVQLRLAIDKAREANMPNDNVKRAIDRATGAGGTAKVEEVLFEAYGPGGIAFLLETATDNHNRTTGDIRAILNKFEGKLAETGAVSYLFEKRGLIVVENAAAERESVEWAVIESDAEDFWGDRHHVYVYTKPNKLDSVRHALQEHGLTIKEANLVWEPKVTIEIKDKAKSERLMDLSEKLEELDDVVHVASNFDLPQSQIT